MNKNILVQFDNVIQSLKNESEVYNESKNVNDLLHQTNKMLNNSPITIKKYDKDNKYIKGVMKSYELNTNKIIQNDYNNNLNLTNKSNKKSPRYNESKDTMYTLASRLGYPSIKKSSSVVKDLNIETRDDLLLAEVNEYFKNDLRNTDSESYFIQFSKNENKFS